jgi:signal transduction histidine kinase
LSKVVSGTDQDRLRAVRLLVVTLGVAVVAWLMINLAVERGALAELGPQGRYALAIVGVVSKVLGAMVLFLLAADGERSRLGWIGGGLLVFALGPIIFNVLSPLPGDAADLDVLLYRRMFVWAFAYALFVAGLLPKSPPRFTWRWAAGVSAAFGALAVALGATLSFLPTLATTDRREISESLFTAAVQPGLTVWHFVFSVVPLALALIAAYGAVTRGGDEALMGWLVAAMVLLAGSQLHYLFWPLIVGSVLTATFVLHFVAGALILLGGIVELRRIAAERNRLLAAEREQSRRMRELSDLKADFTAMVAHELGSPLTAIRGYADMLSTGKLAPERNAGALDAIRSEVDKLNSLVSDVWAAAAVERDDFTVRPTPVELDLLLADAAVFARSLPSGPPLVEKVSTEGRVLADAERVGQVLRNLIDNAARYSPESAQIELRATSVDGTGGAPRVRIEVADRGPGIHPDDLGRVFEKFARGASGQKAPGAGLGLYLSRRIVRAHGGELTVGSTPGEGSVFSFELERAG